MVTDIFLMKCYIALNIANCKWLKNIMQDDRTVTKVFSGFRQIHEDCTDYLLNLDSSLEDTIFFLENYAVISTWLNDYAQANSNKILRGTKEGKTRNIDFIKGCLGIVKMVYPYLEKIEPCIMNGIINADGEIYIKKAAFLSAGYAKDRVSDTMRFVAGSTKWKCMLSTESFETTQAMDCIPILFRWEKEGSPLLSVFGRLKWSQIMQLIEASEMSTDFRNLAEFICIHLPCDQAAQTLLRLDTGIDSRWYLNCLIWVYRKGTGLFEFIKFSEAVEYSQTIIKQAVRKIKCLDPFAIETLLHLPVIYIVAWMFGRHDVFQAYYDIYEHNQGDGMPEKSVVTMAFADEKNRFLKNLASHVFGHEELDWLDNLLKRHRSLFQKLNLNELTEKQLSKIISINNGRIIFKASDELKTSGFFEILGDRRLNLNELGLILEIFQSQKYAHLFLLNLFSRLLMAIRSDDAVIRCRQVMKHMDTGFIEQDNIQAVAKRLCMMDLPSWKRKMFSFPVDYWLVLRALAGYEEIKHALPEVGSAVEARFLIENISLCRESLKEGFQHFIEADYAVNALKNALNLEPEFYELFKKESTNFFLQGNAGIALDYWNGLQDKKLRETYRIILKAAMSDKLHELRYFGNDLAKECSFMPTMQTQQEWMCDRTCEMKSDLFGRLLIYEDTSFSGTLSLGKNPVSTCLNYIDGDHRDCLLSAYDANKKLVYMSVKGGHIIGRAIIRLTKMINRKIATAKTSLSFTDVTTVNAVPTETQTELSEEKAIETPILFLERLYTPCQADERMELEHTVIDFVSEKAKLAGIKAVLSTDYWEAEGFESKRVGIYITRSRAGKQYLDSFGGIKSCASHASADDGKEDTYVFSKCYAAKDEMEINAD